MALKNKITSKTLGNSKINKPDTAMRAGITANLKFTRGKQLVEHDPFLLIPDPYNPRPGEVIDEHWLKKYLHIGTNVSLCRFSETNNEYVIPEFSQLSVEQNESLEESYNFLRELAFSIRADGLIEPIEIFLADRQNDPSYFVNNNLDYGYVILEGHQRRLAAMMSGVPTVTCIEITDETMLVKLKVKHRKLRRQLSENNLRKDLSVAQNFLVFQQLLDDTESQTLTNKQLSQIMGLSEGIVSALKSICTKSQNYPPIFLEKILANKLTFKKIRALVSKNFAEIENTLLEHKTQLATITKPIIKARGRNGGAKKKYATFKVNDEKESEIIHRYLLSKFPEIDNIEEQESTYKTLEMVLNKIREMALKQMSCSGANID
ncbi:MAG: ParB/RepB/Spo0J family partition protein [Legionella sp.]|nr:ParB/RepB/Spo0J family partition protein [Legionella sp.]